MSQPSPSLPIEPFSIRVEEEVLSDLRARIRNTRWPDKVPGVAWEQGTDLNYLRQVLAVLVTVIYNPQPSEVKKP